VKKLKATELQRLKVAKFKSSRLITIKNPALI